MPPIPEVAYVRRPFYMPRYTPDTSRLASIYLQNGRDLALLSQARGNNQAEGLARLSSIIAGGAETARANQTRKEAMALRAQEREQDRKEREAVRAEDKAEKALERADRLRSETRGAARYAVDKAAPGPQSQALFQLAQQFPETAARFSTQAPLEARPVPGAVGEMSSERAEYPVLEPTDEQMQNAGMRQLQRERFAKEDANRVADNQRADAQLAATIANNREMRDIARLNAQTNAAKADGTGGGGIALTPDALDEAAHRVRLFGPGSIPTRFNEADKKRILNRSAEINKSIGQTPAAAAMRAAVQKADQVALNQITKQASSAEAFENKALQQADLVKELSGKVGRTDIPLINGWLVAGKAALGDTPAHLLANALLTYTSEYAKIVEGSTGSAAGSSDAARRAAASLVSTALSKGTLAATIDQMNREMGMTRTGYRTTIDDITSRMSGTPSATPVAPAAPAGGGMIEALDPQGNIHHAPAGTPLPPGWKLKG